MRTVSKDIRKDLWRKTMTKQEQSEKIVYGSLITCTKCYNCIHFPLCFAQKGGVNLELASENDCCYYQSKLPENSIVLSKEELSKRDYEFRQIGYDECLRDNSKKDKYIKKLKHRIDILNAKLDQASNDLTELVNGFGITDEEREAIHKWQNEHIKKAHNGNVRAGAVGGRWVFEFIPTNVGEIGTIKCDCGAEFTFRELQ